MYDQVCHMYITVRAVRTKIGAVLSPGRLSWNRQPNVYLKLSREVLDLKNKKPRKPILKLLAYSAQEKGSVPIEELVLIYFVRRVRYN